MKRSSTIVDRIGFLVHASEAYNHIGSVLDALPQGSFDIVLVDNWAQPDDDIRTGAKRWNCPVVTSDDVIASDTQYRHLVSLVPVKTGLLQKLAVKNIRFMYSAGKSGWTLADWNKQYDSILCFGPYHAAKFLKSCEATVLQMGYPRFDRFFTLPADRERLLAQFGCDAAKKTVVWLPTWKALSSVGLFDEEISALMADYNVVVKLHPLMLPTEPERVTALKRHRFTHLITDSTDNLPLYRLADFMLFDYGGPPLAGIYTDRNLLLLNVPGAENDPLTGAGSPDLTIRQFLTSVNATEGGIARLLADAEYWEKQRASRRKLRNYYFAPYFGFSSQIAAQILLNLSSILPDRA